MNILDDLSKVIYYCDPAKAKDYKKISLDMRQAADHARQLHAHGNCSICSVNLLDSLYQVYDLLFLLAKADGNAYLPCLFDLAGNYADAELINSKFGMCWKIYEPDGDFRGKFVGISNRGGRQREKLKEYKLSISKRMIPAVLEVAIDKEFKVISYVIKRKYKSQKRMMENERQEN